MHTALNCIIPICITGLCVVTFAFSIFTADESDLNGRKDFIRSSKTITFEPSGSSAEQTVFLDFVNDEINEDDEGYFALLRVDASSSNPKDVAELKYILQVTLIKIFDDDGKSSEDKIVP